MKTIKIYFFSLILIISNLSFADVKNGRRSEFLIVKLALVSI